MPTIADMLAPITLAESDRIIERLRTISATSVLSVGPTPGWLACAFAGLAHIDALNDLALATTTQLDRRYDVVVLTTTGCVIDTATDRALLHAAVLHLERDGHLALIRPTENQLPLAAAHEIDLIRIDEFDGGDTTTTLLRRGPRFTVHDLVYEARTLIDRVAPIELHSQLQAADPPLVLDTRTDTDRSRFGVISGSIHVPRTVVEWHLDPSNGYLHPAFVSFDQPIVVVCNGGYSSTLSAANLSRLGFGQVADLIGGMQAWLAAGLPVSDPDHSHLDL
jgi:rhodanese-related sulfurtransferase